MSSFRGWAVTFVIGVSLLMTARSAHAASYTWDVLSGDGASITPGSGTWDLSATNWNSAGTNVAWTQTSAIVGSNTATFSGADGTYSLILGSNVAAQTMTFNTGGYTLAAATPQTLAISNVGTGIFTIANGKSLTVGNNATIAYTGVNNTGTRYNLGNGAVLNVAAGGTLTKISGTGFGGFGFRPNVANDSATINVDGTISWTSTASGSGSLTFAESVAGLITVNVNNGGVITTNTVGTQNSKGAITVGDAGTAVLNVASGGSVSITNTAGTSYLCIGGTGNAGVGTVNLNGGSITAPQVSKKGTGTSSGTFNFNGGTLIANTGTFNSAANAFMGAATGTGGAGTSALDRANVRNGGAKIDTNGFNIWISQPLLHSNIVGDATIDGGLSKSGAGTLTLSGASTYTGATQVNAGGLNVTGSLVSNISVANNAVFGGTGSTTGSIAFGSGSSLSVDVLDEFAANGVDFAGSTTLIFGSALTVGNTYDVIDFGAGGLTSGTSNLVKTSRGTFSTSGTILQFTVGSVATDTWNTTSGVWQVGTTTPWTNGSDNEFWNGDSVIFDDTPGADATATVGGIVIPAAMSVNNSSVNHMWTGSGTISGTGALTKGGVASLTIVNANSYSGGTTLNDGTLVLNNAAAIGTGALTIAGGTLDSTNAATLSTNNVLNVHSDFAFSGTTNLDLGVGAVTLAGAGANRTIHVAANSLAMGEVTSTAMGLVKSGAGTLILGSVGADTGGSSIVGNLDVAAGTLQFNRTGANAAASGDLVVTGLSGSGTITNGAAVARWIFVNNATANTFNGSLNNGPGGALGLVKRGTGSLTLNGTSDYTDTTTVNSGMLTINGANTGAGTNVALGAGTNLVVGNNLALGAASLISLGANNSGTVTFKTDSSTTPYDFSFGSGTTNLNVILDSAGATSVSQSFNTRTANGVGRGNLNISLGGVVTAGALQISTVNMGAGTTGSNTIINPAAGVTVTIGSATKSSSNVSQTLELSGVGAGHQVTGTISNGAPLTGANAISVVKSGASTWTLSGNNTYTGMTEVNSGTLVINGSHSGTGAVTVNNGGTLAGAGAVTGATTVKSGGALSPGTSIESLGVGAVSFEAGSTFTYEINTNLSLAVAADLVFSSGALSIGMVAPGVALSIADAGNTVLPAGTKLTLISYNGTWDNGTFDGLADDSLVTIGANQYVLDYNDTVAGSNFQADALLTGVSFVTLTTAVPEAGAFVSVALAGALALGAVWIGKRRRAMAASK